MGLLSLFGFKRNRPRRPDEPNTMKIMISYPPFDSSKGTPLLGQNRQFQWFHNPTYIYPMVPAYAATLLSRAGHQVIWNDAIAGGKTYKQWLLDIIREKPDIIAFETKTPVIKYHWEIINHLKGIFQPKGTNTPDRPDRLNRPNRPIIVLFGDHVTALPEESFKNSAVDFVLTGGDYDFLLLNLCTTLSQTDQIDQTDQLEPGIYYRHNDKIHNTGKFQLNHDLNSLQFIDRDLTKWRLYSEKNGNYKRIPGTYTMAGRDCWYHKCTFCSWPTIYPEFRTRAPENLLDEIGILIEKYGVREIMDDTGTFPVGKWLEEFCKGMIERGYNKKICLDCNMRFGALSKEEYKLMKRANFRFILFGLESASNETLLRIDKGITRDDIVKSCIEASETGLSPHLTVMFGYPWETEDDVKETVKLGKYLMKKGYANTLQSTIVIPYPGSPLFDECMQKNLLATLDWNDYDMSKCVMKLGFDESVIKKAVQGLYKVAFSPEFVFRRIISIRDIDDIKFILRGMKAVFGHLSDFMPSKSHW